MPIKQVNINSNIVNFNINYKTYHTTRTFNLEIGGRLLLHRITKSHHSFNCCCPAFLFWRVGFGAGLLHSRWKAIIFCFFSNSDILLTFSWLWELILWQSSVWRPTLAKACWKLASLESGLSKIRVIPTPLARKSTPRM